MIQEKDLQAMPPGFVFCYGVGCAKAAECLRCEALASVECERRLLTVVSPKYAQRAGKCEEYLTNSPVQLAYGMSRLYDEMLHKTAVEVKEQLLRLFGKTEYYRKWRQEHPFTPSDQKEVCRILQQNGIDTAPVYDRIETALLWK